MSFSYQWPTREKNTCYIIFCKTKEESNLILLKLQTLVGFELNRIQIYFFLINEEETVANQETFKMIVTFCMNKIQDVFSKPWPVLDYGSCFEPEYKTADCHNLPTLTLINLDEKKFSSILGDIRERVLKRNIYPCMVTLTISESGLIRYFNFRGKEEILREILFENFTKFEDTIPPFDGEFQLFSSDI
jgi:alpha-amylase/alpha-mannosidase (GH57 family)